MPDPGPLLERRRADAQAKATQVLAVVTAMVAAGEPLCVAAVARRARVSRRFIYDHPELRAEIARGVARASERLTHQAAGSARVSTASLRADLENAKARNRRLDAELTALKRRLGELMGAGVAAEIGGGAGDGSAPQLGGRLEELEQALFDAREELARRTEELDAARQINRELLARLNRST
jgi:chromosome segregation ATPase